MLLCSYCASLAHVVSDSPSAGSQRDLADSLRSVCTKGAPGCSVAHPAVLCGLIAAGWILRVLMVDCGFAALLAGASAHPAVKAAMQQAGLAGKLAKKR
jgi:hypothetical protein